MMFSIIFIMQIFFFKFSTTTVKSSTIDNNRSLLKQLISQIDSYIIDIGDISKKLINDDIVLEFLEKDLSGVYQNNIEMRLQNYMEARSDISNILIYSNDGRYILGNPDSQINPWIKIEKSEWFKNARLYAAGLVVSNAHVQNIYLGEYEWVVSISREIFSKVNGKSLGIILVDLKIDKIDDLCRSLIVGDKGYDFIVDDNGEYVYHPLQQLVNSNLRTEPIINILKLYNYGGNQNYFEDNDRLFLVEKSLITNWNIVSVIYNSDIVTDWKHIQVMYTLIGIFLFLLVSRTTKRISKGITEPIRKLQNLMTTVENGALEFIGPIKGTDEIRCLAHDYDIMVGKIHELMETNSREHELKRKSDLKALQAQINPHFLYNTLDSIIWMGEMGQSKAVVKMTSALSKLFRISISKGNEIITLKDELAHVESYLTIQEMRYQDKFRYFFDIDPNLLEHPILKITLQPLVENAIYHGIKEGEKQGIINIVSSYYDNKVVIRVKDNGEGMDNRTLKALNDGLNSNQDDKYQMDKQGMGLRNVHQRIKLYFGKEYGLSIESTLGYGTTIIVTIPHVDKGQIL